MKNEKYYELDITAFSNAHLRMIYACVTHGNWDGLTMSVNDAGRILITGWATKSKWNRFVKFVINDHKFDYIYEEEEIDDLELD